MSTNNRSQGAQGEKTYFEQQRELVLQDVATVSTSFGHQQKDHTDGFTEPGASATKHEHTQQKLGKRYRCTSAPQSLPTIFLPFTFLRGSEIFLVPTDHGIEHRRHRLTCPGLTGWQ
jgi:hypothetical protein